MGGGAGSAKLDEVPAWGGDVEVGVVVLGVNVDMGGHQVVGLGIEGPCEVVLSLLGVGCKVSILSGGGVGREWAGVHWWCNCGAVPGRWGW